MSTAQAVAITGSDQAITPGRVKYHGFSLRETAGSTAVVRIYDGTSATGTLLDSVSFVANESAREWYPDGIETSLGIYVDIISGAVEGSVRFG